MCGFPVQNKSNAGVDQSLHRQNYDPIVLPDVCQCCSLQRAQPLGFAWKASDQGARRCRRLDVRYISDRSLVADGVLAIPRKNRALLDNKGGLRALPCRARNSSVTASCKLVWPQHTPSRLLMLLAPPCYVAGTAVNDQKTPALHRAAAAGFEKHTFAVMFPGAPGRAFGR
jgi:hypothetical protein